MTTRTPRLPREQYGALLFPDIHRVSLPACEAIDRRIGENNCEFELGTGFPEHREIDWPAGRNAPEEFAEQRAVGRGCI